MLRARHPSRELVTSIGLIALVALPVALALGLAPLQVLADFVAFCVGPVVEADLFLHGLAPILLGTSVIIVAAKWIGRVRSVRRALRLYPQRRLRPDDPLYGIANRAAATNLVYVLEGSAPLLAFVHGLLRPRIYLAEGLQQELTVPELEAVFRHELHHCRRLDPVRYSLVSTVADALFWIPLVPLAAERLITRLEYAADDAASERGALPLASAILRVAKVQATPMVDPGLSTPHLVERRVTRLLDAAGSTLPPIRTGVVVRSAVVLAAVWMLAIVSSASHTTHVTGCVRSSSETPHSAELGQCESADSGWDATFSRATDATGRLVHAVPPLLPRREPAARREDPV